MHLANLVDQEATGAPEADEVVSGTVSAPAVGPRGGVRQRFEASSSSSSAAPVQPRVESVREKKGGVAERAAKAAKAGKPEKETPFFKILKRDWGKGQISSPKVQEYAEAHMASGGVGAESLASAGASGRHPQNLQRAFVHVFGQPKGVPEFTWARIPTSMGEVLHRFFCPIYGLGHFSYLPQWFGHLV